MNRGPHLSTVRRRSAGAGLAVAVAALLASTLSAAADFRLCNRTTSKVGVALGYKGEQGWITEGWWNMPANSCHTLLEGTLASRYYYVFAIDYDRGGEWGGKAFMCTQDKMFTILGIEDCVKRGFQKSGFFEIDTGEQKSWTVQLTEPTRRGASSSLQP